jgi:hypothetical protein
MTEETDLTPVTDLDAEETPEEESLASALAPIALMAAGVAGTVYLVRKIVRRNDVETETEETPEAIEATSKEV